MEIEKRRSRGSFLSFFYWNGVSRKKLFYANPNLPEDLKQAKGNVENKPKSQLKRTQVGENGIKPSNISSCDFNSELLVRSDGGCETKPPGLVARLMGLDSLPTSTVTRLSSTALHASNSLGSSHCHEVALDCIESRVRNRTNKRFQSEILPQNLARPIQLLSPIIPPKNALSSSAASSIPLRILGLEQKSEAACYAPTLEEFVNTNPVKGSRDSEKISPHHYGSKGKSTLLATQAKADVQSRDTLTSNGNRGYKQKEHNKTSSKQLFRTHKPILQQVVKQKTCTKHNSNANELGQSSVTNKGRLNSIVDSKKLTTRSSTGGARKTTDKGSVIANVGPKCSGRRANDVKKEFPLSKTKSNSKKKRYTARDVLLLPDNDVNNYESKSRKCNIPTDWSMNRDASDKKASKDVISFTFTSPLRKESQTQSSTHVNNVDVNPPGLHMIDGDALSVLSERKVQELTSRTNSPQCTLATGGFSAVLGFSEVSTKSRDGDRSSHSDLNGGKLHSMNQHHYGCSSSDGLMLNMNLQLQGSKAMAEHSCFSNIETQYDQGSGVCFCIQDEESNEQSSCTLVEDMAAQQLCGLSNMLDYNRSRNYVKDILSNAELMEENYALDQTNTNKVLKTNVFDMLEKRSNGTESNGEEYSKLGKNLLLDCVGECLQFRRSRQTLIGSYKAWPVQTMTWLAEDLYREILGHKSMLELMVDELVYEDMSSPHGTWLHFQTEAFEQVLEIEWDISTSLINDLISDLLLL